MRLIYDLGFLIFGIFSLPHFLKRIGQADEKGRLLRERFGFFPSRSFSGGQPLWIHCVSVGETLAAEKLIRLILEDRNQSVVLTTVTPTGQRIAKQWEGERLKVFYFPFDVRFAVRRFFEAVQPKALLLVETEIWPNVIEEAKRREIPVFVVNGRLSERSFKAFRRFSFIFKPLLSSIHSFLVQTTEDEKRLLLLGVDPEKIQVTGNMKLDLFELNGQWQKDRTHLRSQWGFHDSDQILIGGSTHEGEEEILFNALDRLREERFPLKLILAPRHVERSERILKLGKIHGFKTVRATHFQPHDDFDVLILDRLGELRKLYAVADAVFVGGSLIRHGGQNPIEPAASRRAIIHGPWVFNFEEIYRRLDEEGASIRINGEEELVFVLKRLLASDREREYLGTQAHDTLLKLQGATERNFRKLEGKL